MTNRPAVAALRAEWEKIQRQLASVIHAARTAGPFSESQPQFEESVQGAKRKLLALIGAALEAPPPGNLEEIAHEIHAAWRDGMLAAGRPVSQDRLAWETLWEKDRELDRYIAARVARLLLGVRGEAPPEETKCYDPAHIQPPPTDADEPPWPGWFSCSDCYGWFYGEGIAYDSGDVRCDACAKEYELPSTAQRQEFQSGTVRGEAPPEPTGLDETALAAADLAAAILTYLGAVRGVVPAPSPDGWSAIADSLAAALIHTLNGTMAREDAEARLAAYYEFTPGRAVPAPQEDKEKP